MSDTDFSKRPDLQTQFDRNRALFENNVLGGGSLIEESPEWYVVANDTAMSDMFYAISDQMAKERDPRTACCENLIDIAAQDGFYPRPATGAEGFIRVTGTPGTALDSNLNITFGDSEFRPQGSVPQEIPASGEVVIRYRSIGVGEASNIQEGLDTGRFVNTPTGLDANVTVFGNQFCGGQDAENCEAFRQRYLQRKQFQPHTDQAWLINKIMEWPCVTRVCVRAGACCTFSANSDDETCCGSNLEFYPIMDGTFECGLPPFSVVQEIDRWLFGETPGHGEGQAPIGVCGSLFTATACPVDLVISGAVCLTATQRQEIQTTFEEFFRTLCPSEAVSVKRFDAIIAQISERFEEVDLRIEPTDDCITIDECDGLVPGCDIMPCLGEIRFEEF